MFQLRQSLLLFITATIWGSGFVAQSIGMDHITPFTYTFFRTLIGAIVLLPLIIYLNKKARKEAQEIREKTKEINQYKTYHKKDLLIGSICCGFFLIAGESFQQYGLVTTDAGKAGFITSMYIVFVPILGLFLGKKLNFNIILGVVLSIVGLYLLCIKDELVIEKGDILILICAVVFSMHILTIDHFINKCNGVQLACGQFFSASFMGLCMMLIFDYDVFSWEDVRAASLALLWSGVMSNGVAYTLQIVGQRGMHPTIATIILSLESVMAVVFGILLLNESLTVRESIGCILILIAVLVAQVSLSSVIELIKNRKIKTSIS